MFMMMTTDTQLICNRRKIHTRRKRGPTPNFVVKEWMQLVRCISCVFFRIFLFYSFRISILNMYRQCGCHDKTKFNVTVCRSVVCTSRLTTAQTISVTVSQKKNCFFVHLLSMSRTSIARLLSHSLVSHVYCPKMSIALHRYKLFCHEMSNSYHFMLLPFVCLPSKQWNLP